MRWPCGNGMPRVSRRKLLMAGSALMTVSALRGNWASISLAGTTFRTNRELDRSPMPRLQVNILDALNNDNFRPFIRWERRVAISESPILVVRGTQYGSADIFDNGWFDENYDLVDPLPSGATSYIMYIHQIGQGLTYLPDLGGKAFTVAWDNGAAVTNVTLGSDTRNSLDLTGRTATFIYNAGNGGFSGRATDNSPLTFTLSGTSGPPTNIRVYLTANQRRLDAGEIFDPDWLAEVSQWKILRLMVAMGVNGSGAVHYTDLPTENFRFWNGVTTTNPITSGKKPGLPVTVIAALANQTGRPIWICVPHEFTDSAITSLATNLKNLVDPSIMIYVEYSNEIWNTGFAQTSYCNTQAASSGTALTGTQWSGLRAAQVSEIFRTVFGTDSGTRWTGVLGTQVANVGITTAKFAGIDYHIANNAGAASTTAKLFTHLAVTTYFGVDVANAFKTFTSSNIDATANTFTMTNIGNGQLPANTPITFTTTGALPSPLQVGTTFYVKISGANVIQFAAAPGGSAIDLTDTGSGTTVMRIEPGASLSDWADESIDRDDDYAYFKEQLYNQLKSSASADVRWGNIQQSRSYWLAQLAILGGLRGLTLCAYEGGNGSACQLPLRDNGTGETEGTKLNLAFANFADSEECAILHDEIYDLFLSDGGVFPSKYVDLGMHTKYGPWGGAQYLGDTNPVYTALRDWNKDSPVP